MSRKRVVIGTKRRLVKGLWNCNHCDSTKISGEIKECPNCGAPRNENTIPYLDRKKIVYVPEEQAIHINRNPDWLCKYCGRANSDDEKQCVSCAAPRTSENLDYLEIQKTKAQELAEKIAEEQEENENFSETNYQNTSNISSYSSNCKKKSFSFEKFSSYFSSILITLLTVFGIIGLISLFIPKEKELTIQEIYWNRCIDIEKYQPVQESDWSLPSGARLLYSQEELFDTVKVLDHIEIKTREVEKERVVGTGETVVGYEDLGNGYFEEIVEEYEIVETYIDIEEYEEEVYRYDDIYKTKYYYEVDKWVYERSVKTKGYDKKPYWGEYTLKSDEKVSSQTESFHISGIDEKGNSESCTLPYEDWYSLEVGQTVKIKISFGYGEIVE